MDSYEKWEVVSGPDETPLRVHKALSHLGFNISVFQYLLSLLRFFCYLGIYSCIFININLCQCGFCYISHIETSHIETTLKIPAKNRI